jgi:MOSC domain-containing protein YiiM
VLEERAPRARAAMSGRLEAIFLRPGARLPVRRVERALAIAGVGLDGDHADGGKRQVTVLSREGWDAACRELGAAVDPRVRRANLLVSGIDLAATIDGELRIGDVRIEVLGETRPCELLEAPGRIGLCAALRPGRRGGVHGRVVAGGELRCGMNCLLAAAPTPREDPAPDHPGEQRRP